MTKVDISYRRLGRIAGPVLIANLSYTAMGVIDTIMVGRLGVTALAAVGLGSLIAFSALSFVWGMLSGVNTLVAQAVGARDREAVGRVFFQGIYLAALSAVVVSLLWPLIQGLLAWIGPGAGVKLIATDYMRIRILGCAGVILLWTVDNFYRGLGRTRLMMWCGMAQLLVNCGLNYLLIFGKLGAPKMGAAGAALGTVLAQFLVALFMLATVLWLGPIRREFEVWKSCSFRPSLFGRLLRLSLPIGVQYGLEMGGVTVFTALVARLGEVELAATNAVIQAWNVGYMGGIALSVGATTLVGQCIGAGERGAARIVVGRVMRIGYLFTVAIGALYVLAPNQIMALFVSGEELPSLLPFARPLGFKGSSQRCLGEQSVQTHRRLRQGF